ncbi:heparinase II/III family protein [Catellatospora tritici]|uniref:heparinase II/III family protein n=1 Tax=Catellatospora tritici TaxID=2851566 RepID=UPI001C2D0251|nr:heparinase II/III family protein [Catellatospora tritici]MBV1852916.1 heparinase II/III-family protein [Catellatospora tritici]
MPESGFPRPVGALASLLRDLRSAADGDPMPELSYSAYRDFFDTGNRIRYERRYFRRRARLAARAAQALLDPATDLGPLADTLWSVCDEYTWALPAHVRPDGDPTRCLDLFAAETAHTLAETVAALRDRLDPRVADRVRAEVDRRVFAPFTEALPLSWEGSGNNWEAVCAGAVGMAALALLGDAPAQSSRLAAMLDRSRRAMDRYLAGFGDDGGCAEGVDYWVYGFGYFTYFAEALRAHTGEDLMAAPKVRQIAAFPHRAALGAGAHVPFSDASERPWLPAGLLTRLAERFGTPPARVIPSLHDDHCYRWGHLSRTLAWFRPIEAPAATEPVSFLPDLGWVIQRGRFAFAAKGGHNDEPHNHNDLGHFILHTHGESVLDDLGAGEYTADYFGPRRYDSLQPSARGHSVPVIDGQAQLPGPHRAARILRYATDGDTTCFDLDLTTAYEVAGLRSLIRRFRWSPVGRLELVDEIVVERPLRVEEMFISRRRPSFTPGTADWGGLVTLSHDCPETTLEEVVPTNHQALPDPVYRLRCAMTAATGRSTLRFVFDLT